MDDLLGTYEILLVHNMIECLALRGYQTTTRSVKILRKHLLDKFYLKSFRDATEDEYNMMMMYLDVWKPSARMRFRLREYKMPWFTEAMRNG